ncbi:MAG TPA: hypothetical protein VE978_05505, partial [Chitinophagales bacterium]|nr:hypothetical protein [Chitinophagales bacterium]
PKNSHANLTITNKSNIRIRSIIYWNYPDTLIEKVNPKYDGTEGLLKNKSFTMHAPLLSCWESVFTNGREEWIYFFNADTIETLNWDTVRQTHRGLLERRQIDLDYLQKNDFTIMFQ